MTMHAALNRGSTAGAGEVFFFAEMPEAAIETQAPTIAGGGYGQRSGPNWLAIAIIVGLHVIALVALVKLDIISVQKPKVVNLKVFDIAELAPPPMEQPKPEKVVEKVEPVVVTPVSIVQTLAPPPPPIQVTTTPPPPMPVVAPASPKAAPAPTQAASTDLIEHRISGKAPGYPYESRRNKEQGTVSLRVIIGTDGRIVQISIAKSSGFDRLDKAALNAVKDWRWEPNPNGDGGIISIPFVLAPSK